MRRLVALTGLVGLALLQGCSAQTVTGSPPSGVSASVSGSSAPLAPKVENPLPASLFTKHPCDSSLTDGQLTQLLGEVPASRHTDNQAGPGCGWTKRSTGAGINIAWMIGLKSGLSDYYAQKSTDAFQQPIEVGGYPAVEYNSTEASPITDCSVGVGIADNLVFDSHYVVGSNRRGTLNPCDAAKSIAQNVLENLQAAAR